MRSVYERVKFQSTLPTRGSDSTAATKSLLTTAFQSTLPTRGSDITVGLTIPSKPKISIHAPHEGERPQGEPFCMERI